MTDVTMFFGVALGLSFIFALRCWLYSHNLEDALESSKRTITFFAETIVKLECLESEKNKEAINLRLKCDSLNREIEERIQVIEEQSLILADNASQIAKLEAEAVQDKKEIDALKTKHELWESQVRAVHQDIDEQIEQMLQEQKREQDRKIASAFDRQFGRLAKVKSFKDKDIALARKAIQSFKALDLSVKCYVRLDIIKLQRIISEHDEMKAKEAGQGFNVIAQRVIAIQPIWTPNNVNLYNHIIEMYNNLSELAQQYVEQDLITEVFNRLNQASLMGVRA